KQFQWFLDAAKNSMQHGRDMKVPKRTTAPPSCALGSSRSSESAANISGPLRRPMRRRPKPLPWRNLTSATSRVGGWSETRAKYRGKTQGRPVGTNHCKFLSSHPRVPDDGRDRALDGGRQEVQPLRPSGRDYDPDWLSPRLAGVRVV